jgi:hypothetical protein
LAEEGRAEDNQMLGAFLIEARLTSKLITQENANEIIKNKFKNPSSLHSSFAFMLLHNRSLLVLCRHLATSFLLWPEEPFKRRKRAKHVVHKANNMSLIKQIICLCILVGLVVQIKWSLAQNTIGGNKFKFGS